MIHYSAKPASSIGGKAAGLYKLRALGLQVPDFMVITYESFETVTQTFNGSSIHEEDIATSFKNFMLPEKELAQLLPILDQWQFGKTAVVVRSSILDEDSSTHAFPGVMQSFLNITTLGDLHKSIASCAASAWSPTAVAYRKQHDLNTMAQVAVIIQQQIEPDASGVAFSTFPEYPQELAIHAVYGFSEGLMNGDVAGDEFYFDKSTGILHRERVVRKDVSLSRKRNNQLINSPVPTHEQEKPCLAAAQLQELFTTIQQAEITCGYPIDLEFAIKDHQIFYLQLRPITQSIPEVIVYDNSNIQESYCGVTTPLTFSFASLAYRTVYKQTMRELGLSKEIIDTHENTVANLLGLVKGRIYYNINNWYRGLQLLPSFKQNKQDMETMMGLQEPVDFIQSTNKTVGQKIVLLPQLLLNYYRLWRKITKLKRDVPAFQNRFDRYYETFYKNNIESIDSETLQAFKSDLDSNLLDAWSVPIINDFNVMMANGSALRMLKKAGFQKPEEFLGRFLAGDQEIESTQPTLAIIKLAELASSIAPLKDLVLRLPGDIASQVKQEFPDFNDKVELFIERYGDRTVGELKLETITMRVAPLIFYKYLRNFLLSETVPSISLSKTTEAAKKELKEHLNNSSYFIKLRLPKKLDHLKKAIQYRESLRLQRTRLFGMYRHAYRAYGAFLKDKSALKSIDDIFYLTENEITNPDNDVILQSTIEERKVEFANYQKTEVPSRVIVPSPPLTVQESTNEPGILTGQGCYPGKVTGEVIVIKDPTDSLDVHDKIICALRTDPGWAALFPVCKAVLIEKGSALSHSVIMLRELGIPTIINVSGLCKELSSGMVVEIDATAGQINMNP